MMPETVIELDNDGLNMAADENRLYVRCKMDMCSYSKKDMSELSCNTVFKKDGKARTFSLFGDFVYLTDFCDLYILNKNDFQVLQVFRIGHDLSSDLGVVRFDSFHAYIAVRNGAMAVLDVLTHEYRVCDVASSSFWDFCVIDNLIYAGTTQGELLEIDTGKMQVLRKVLLGNKNIYGVVRYGDYLYTVSQDMSIKALHADTLEIAFQAKKATKGMARILGVYQENLFVADSNKVSVWDTSTLHHQDTVAFPTGQYNKGVLLSDGMLFGSDSHYIYQMILV